ncbi:MAG: precorrin-6A reductase [Eubacteriales bacterium]|nr:precorrin-6A reductase [Eubacteriales bacterium]
MSEILIFAGTTEGRELAEYLGRQQVSHEVCVATEYGKTLLEENEYRKVRAGRLDEKAMEQLLAGSGYRVVVDATHPYAVEVSANIRSACEHAQIEYIRLLRASRTETLPTEEKGTVPGNDAVAWTEDLVVVSSVEAAVDFLEHTQGSILVTTGSKELHKYTRLTDYRERVFARVLSTPEVAKSCAELGFEGKHLICMQGPFSEELNTAMLRQFGAEWLVTKEAGKTGGFEEKLRAAQKAGAKVVLIGRPTKEQGNSLEEVKRILTQKLGLEVRREIAVVGIGMGTEAGMTLEAREVCKKADLLIGAGRMLQMTESWGIPTYVSYKPQEIAEYVYAHPEYEKIALLQSGDVGFYSGAKKLLHVFAKECVQVYPGISSVVYLCAKLHTSWEDVCLTSLHGRSQNVIAKVQRHEKVFALVGKGEGVRELCKKLISYGLGDVSVTVGEELSYPAQRIRTERAKLLAGETFADLCVVLIRNPKAAPCPVHGLEDEAFLRGKAPMTKCEIRAVSISKLQLTRDAVVYDVGAGTGSVSVEAALQAEDGAVYAIEKKPDAVELLRENRRRFAVDHLQIVEGLAPEALCELPAPTHVFVGGSSGNLKEILETVLEKNPKVRIVINCIALETVAEALECLKTLPVTGTDIVSLSAARSKEVGRYHMMMGQNPVYVISCTGKGEEDE